MTEYATTAVVTGASGFIGHHLVAALLAEGRAVHALCRNPEPLDDVAAGIASTRCGDLGDPDLYADLLDAETTVFHLAAVRDPGATIGEHRRINLDATAALARAANDAGVHRFVHVSSALVFGPSDGRPRRVTDGYDRAWDSTDPYVATRIEISERLRDLVAEGLRLVIVSPSIVYGPDGPRRRNRIADRIRRLERWPIVPTLGAAPRSLVYVGDVVDALLGAERRAPLGEELIVAGEAVTPRQFDAAVRSATGRGGVSVPVPKVVARATARLAGVLPEGSLSRRLLHGLRRLDARWEFDDSESRQFIGHRPTSLAEGLTKTLDGLSPSRHGQRRRWEEIASSMRDFSGAATTGYYRRREQALIRRAAGPLTGQRVLKLDLWNEAINTRILNWMRTEGADVVGLDWSHVVAERARRNSTTEDGTPLALVRADIRELPFTSGRFDLVYTMGTIEHIAEYQTAVDEVTRVLRPGGRAIVGVPHRWDPFLRPLFVRLLDLFGRYPYAPERSFSARQLESVLGTAGLEVETRTGILALPGLVRMLDLYLHTRGRTSRRLIPRLLAPFEWLESRSGWFRRHVGYLLTMVGTKPER